MLLGLSLRNLLRQKRRNLLLGSAMAIGVMLLVMANSFSRGLTDIMLNKILRWVTGHVSVAFNERGRMMTEVFRDKSRFDFIGIEFKDLLLDQDEAIGAMARVIGNGRADNMIVVGFNMRAAASPETLKETQASFRVVEGSYEALLDERLENPVLLSVEKAKILNCKLHDTLRLRMRNVFGQDQSARVTVVGLLSTSNIFMGPVMFAELQDLKRIMGYDEHSIGSLSLTLKNPEKDARKLADAIHARLKPGLAAISGVAVAAGRERPALLLGYDSDPAAQSAWEKQLVLLAGDFKQARLDKQTLVAAPLAKTLNLKLGDALSVRYTDKWGRPGASFAGKIGGIFDPGTQWSPDLVLAHDDRFYESFYARWPAPPATEITPQLPNPQHPAYALLAPEWVLLPRTKTMKELEAKFREMGKRKWRSTLIDVRTMYETADQILKLEGVINMITLIAVLVLFFIILIGVVNTLRMTIRERTREIGTIRAIGMHQSEVRNLFLLETLALAGLASLAGVLLALLAMALLSRLDIPLKDNPMGMFLVDGHLYFLPSWLAIVGNAALIMLLAGVTAYFPARRAAKMPPGAALRHFE